MPTAPLHVSRSEEDALAPCSRANWLLPRRHRPLQSARSRSHSADARRITNLEHGILSLSQWRNPDSHRDFHPGFLCRDREFCSSIGRLFKGYTPSALNTPFRGPREMVYAVPLLDSSRRARLNRGTLADLFHKRKVCTLFQSLRTLSNDANSDIPLTV